MTEQLYRAEDNTALRFFTKADKNNFQSEKHGRPIFDTCLMVEIITPGSTQQVPEFVCERTYCDEAGLPPKRTEYYSRFEKQIEAFKAQSGAYAVQGTPLAAWPVIDAGTVATLQAVGIQTVEQLAEVSDGNLQNIGTGGRTLREQARQWKLSSQLGAPTAQTGARIAELERLLEAKDAEIASLRAQLAAPAPVAAPPALEVPEIVDPSPAGGLEGPLAGLGLANPQALPVAPTAPAAALI